MREISTQDLVIAPGAGDANSQLISDMASNVAWGATLGVPGGLHTMAVGADSAA